MTSQPGANWLWRPALIVFVSNACFMIIEIVAGRIVAPHIGVSLYSWTSIIGVMLGGISIGNWLGGRLADRAASRPLLGAVFIASGLLAWSVLWTVQAFGTSGLFDLPLSALPRMLVYIAAMFLLPSVALGFVSPIVIKLAMRDLNTTGATIGRIYAASTFGSIIGTFATGFFLISAFGTRNVLLGAGAVLVAMGLLLGEYFARSGGVARALPNLAAAGVLAVVPLLPRTGVLKGPCMHETDYFCIRIFEDEANGAKYTVLQLDRLVHSFTSVSDPTKLRYGYEMVKAELAEYLVQRDGMLDVFVIGAGGYTIPNYFEHVYGNKATIEVGEIDPKLLELGFKHFGLKPDTRIKTHLWDARWYFAKEMPADRKFSLILEDAANDFSVPYHLTTHEFNQLVRKHLRDDGIYAINLLDGENMQFVGGVIRTLKQTYPHLYFVPNGKWIGIPNNTYLILASGKPIDMEKLKSIDAGDGWLNTRDWSVDEATMNEVAANNTFLLTDDFVPTDNLLLPMFEHLARK